MVEVEKLGGVLKRISNFGMSTFNERLVFQKTIYLLQAFGLYLGYRFSWYIYGPYSTELTKDGFKLIEIYDKLPRARFTESAAEKRFDEYLSFLGERKNDADWLEIVSSIHFLKRLYPSSTKEEIISYVSDKQPYIRKAPCEQAWNYLKKYELIKEVNEDERC